MTGSGDEPSAERVADGGGVGLDEEVLYLTVRRAVRDALLDVVGTVALVVIALGFVWAGVVLLVRPASPSGLVLGALLTLAEIVLAWWATMAR